MRRLGSSKTLDARSASKDVVPQRPERRPSIAEGLGDRRPSFVAGNDPSTLASNSRALSASKSLATKSRSVGSNSRLGKSRSKSFEAHDRALHARALKKGRPSRLSAKQVRYSNDAHENEDVGTVSMQVDLNKGGANHTMPKLPKDPKSKHSNRGHDWELLFGGDPLSIPELDEPLPAVVDDYAKFTAMTAWLDRNSMGERIVRKRKRRELGIIAKSRDFWQKINAISSLVDNEWWWVLLVCFLIIFDTILVVLVMDAGTEPVIAMILHCISDSILFLEFLINAAVAGRKGRNPLEQPLLWWDGFVVGLAIFVDWGVNLGYRAMILTEKPKYGGYYRGPIMILRIHRLRKLERLIPHDTAYLETLRRSRPSRVVEKILRKSEVFGFSIIMSLCFITLIAGLLTRTLLAVYEEDDEEEVPPAVEAVINAYFPNVARSMATFLMIAIHAANDWSIEIYKPLEEEVRWFAPFLLGTVTVLDVLVMNALLGIVVELVLTVGMEDDVLVEWHVHQHNVQSQKLRQILERMDLNRDGLISKYELELAFAENPTLSTHLGQSKQDMMELFDDYDLESAGAVSVPVLLLATIMSFYKGNLDHLVENYLIRTALTTVLDTQEVLTEMHHDFLVDKTPEVHTLDLSIYRKHAMELSDIAVEFEKVDRLMQRIVQVIRSIDWDNQERFIPEKAQVITTKVFRANLQALEIAVDRWFEASEEYTNGLTSDELLACGIEDLSAAVERYRALKAAKGLISSV